MQPKIEIYKAVKQKYEQTILSIPGVTSIGVSEQGIVVTVKDAQTAQKIPKTIEGVPVQIRIATYGLLSTQTERVRPVPGGVSIGAVTITAGTNSCAVRSLLTGEILGLSNAHVLGAPCYGLLSLGRGTPIVQPGVIDGGVDPDDRVGVLWSWVPIEPYKPVPVDAALYKPTSPAILSDKIFDLNFRPVSPVDPQIGMQVRKVGRTTGLTFGTVTETDVSLQVESEEYMLYDCFIITSPPTQKFHIWFNVTDEYGRILVPACQYRPAFSLPGDSGSLILLADDIRPVGLVFAGAYDPATESFITVACKASNIEKALKVSFLSPIPILPQAASFLLSFSTAFTLSFKE